VKSTVIPNFFSAEHATTKNSTLESNMTISAEDRFEIQDIIIQIYQALDNHRGSEYASFFTPDGCLENESFGVIRGREAIAKFIQAHCEAGNENGALHCISNLLIEQNEAKEATVRAEVMKFRVSVAPPELWVSSFVTAQMHHAETRWQVARFNLGIRS